jgi:hypothetical protein
MADVINLRQQRKAKARTQKEKQAAENRALHGQTKAEKQKKKREKERAERLLDGHKRETEEE